MIGLDRSRFDYVWTSMRHVGIVVPALNEENYLPQTIDALERALAAVSAVRVEFTKIVVDDGSSDSTASVASDRGWLVIEGPKTGIAAARNRGAMHADVELLIFVDADTLVPEHLVALVVEEFDLNGVRAMAVPGDYASDRISVRILLSWWRWYAPRHNSTQGIFQAFEAGLFQELSGYDETLHMAEDTDLFDRAVKHLEPAQWKIFGSERVQPSQRRYEQTGALALWLLTNPLTTKHFRRRRKLWRSWTRNPPR